MRLGRLLIESLSHSLSVCLSVWNAEIKGAGLLQCFGSSSMEADPVKQCGREMCFIVA